MKYYLLWEDIKVKDSYDFLLPVILDKLWEYWQLNKIIRNQQRTSVNLSVMAEVLSLNRSISPNSYYQVSKDLQDIRQTSFKRKRYTKPFSKKGKRIRKKKVYFMF